MPNVNDVGVTEIAVADPVPLRVVTCGVLTVLIVRLAVYTTAAAGLKVTLIVQEPDAATVLQLLV